MKNGHIANLRSDSSIFYATRVSGLGIGSISQNIFDLTNLPDLQAEDLSFAQRSTFSLMVFAVYEPQAHDPRGYDDRPWFSPWFWPFRNRWSALSLTSRTWRCDNRLFFSTLLNSSSAAVSGKASLEVLKAELVNSQFRWRILGHDSTTWMNKLV